MSEEGGGPDEAVMQQPGGPFVSLVSGDCNSVNIKDDLLRRLNEDLLGCDVQISLFYSAAFSYRFESILKPFPPMFNSSGDDLEKDIELLVSLT